MCRCGDAQVAFGLAAQQRVGEGRDRRSLGWLVLMALVATGCGETPAPSVSELARASLATLDGELPVQGLSSAVEVLRDRHGIPHIYATNIDDLLRAQGFVTAQDRLWQMELWRRQHQGRFAEIFGEDALAYDRLQRLLRFRGPFDDAEWTSYHPEGKRIFQAYAEGINAFIEANRSSLPVEFRLTGVVPEPWVAEDLLGRARVSWAVSGARAELELAMEVARLGVEEAGRQNPTVPSDTLTIPEGLEVSLIHPEVLEGLDGGSFAPRRPILLPEFVGEEDRIAAHWLDGGVPELSPGSNNWAIRPALTATGNTLVVDDPHRQVTNPAHRHLVHLSAPGWEIAGAIEPGLPGVMRGHNGKVAWGRTATTTDLADVYVEHLNPDNPDEVLFDGRWEPLTVVEEEIRVHGGGVHKETLRFSRHGPIFFRDVENNRAYALRSFLTEPGTAEYVGGLQLNQASSARDCLWAADHMPMPPTNLVCGDAEGNIAFRVAAFAPRRVGWSGRLPVPGTGGFEWQGRRRDLPSEFNPERGYIVTANNDTHPPDFRPPYSFLVPGLRYRRQERLEGLLGSTSGFTVEDMIRLLNDAYNGEAVENQAYFRGWSAGDTSTEWARREVADWDGLMRRESRPALLYMAWRDEVDVDALARLEASERGRVMEAALARALEMLEAEQGPDRAEWRWGRRNLSRFPHPVHPQFDLPAVERNGGAGTINAVGGVYRLITNFAEVDDSRVTIAPGVSGQAESPFYGNLLVGWASGEFFRLPFTRSAVEAATVHRLRLVPAP